MSNITLDDLVLAYENGIFPMSEDRDDPELFWVEPTMRGILPLDAFHIPKRLARTVKSDRFKVLINSNFSDCIEACSTPMSGRQTTWINGEIIELYTQLNRIGRAHSVECWRWGKLVGGLYGVSIGAAFFGESMFSLERDASKVALVHLVARLKTGGYQLLDTQFVTDHLKQFGAVEIPKAEYKARLSKAIKTKADFYKLPVPAAGSEILQSITQTS